MTSTPIQPSVDREVLAVLTALGPMANDSRLVPVFRRLDERREFDVEEVLDSGWSSGERALIEWAGALWNGTGQVDIGYVACALSDHFLHAALGALAARTGRPIPAFDSSGLPVPVAAESE
jgi:hypothetical protein